MELKIFSLPIIENEPTEESVSFHVLSLHNYTYDKNIIGYLIFEYKIGGMSNHIAIAINADLSLGGHYIYMSHLKRISEMVDGVVTSQSSISQFICDSMSYVDYIAGILNKDINDEDIVYDIFNFIEESIQQKFPDKEKMIGNIIEEAMELDPTEDEYDIV